jgi:hypothetical protein
VDLSRGYQVGRKLLIERECTDTTNAEIRNGSAAPKRVKTIQTNRQRVVDRVTVRDKEKDEFVTNRTYCRLDMGGDKDPSDPPLVGTTIETRFVGEKGWLSSVGEIPAPKSALSFADALDATTNAWLPLPAKANVGDEIDVNLKTVAAFLFMDNEDSFTRVFARLKVEAPKGDDVVLSGTLRATAAKDMAPFGSITIKVEGPIQITWNHNRGYFREIKIDASIEAAANAPGTTLSIQLSGSTVIKITATDGPAADAALRAPVKFRNVRRNWAAGSLSFELPSHWYLGDEDLECINIFTGVDSDVQHRMVEVKEYATPSAEKALEENRKSLEDQYKTRAKSVRSGTGPGFHMSVEREGVLELWDVYADKDRLIRVRLFDSGKPSSQSIKDLEIIRKSIKRIE